MRILQISYLNTTTTTLETSTSSTTTTTTTTITDSTPTVLNSVEQIHNLSSSGDILDASIACSFGYGRLANQVEHGLLTFLIFKSYRLLILTTASYIKLQIRQNLVLLK